MEGQLIYLHAVGLDCNEAVKKKNTLLEYESWVV